MIFCLRQYQYALSDVDRVENESKFYFVDLISSMCACVLFSLRISIYINIFNEQIITSLRCTIFHFWKILYLSHTGIDEIFANKTGTNVTKEN